MCIKEIALFHFYRVVKFNRYKSDIKLNFGECFFPPRVCFICEERHKYKCQ